MSNLDIKDNTNIKLLETKDINSVDKKLGNLVENTEFTVEKSENKFKIVEFVDDENRQKEIISILDKHLIA